MSILEKLATTPIYAFYIKLIFALVILIGFIIFKRFFHRLVLKPFSKLTLHTKFPLLIDDITKAIERPIELFWLITGIYLALLASPFIFNPPSIQPTLYLSEMLQLSLDLIPIGIVHTCYSACVIGLVAWSSHSFVDIYEKVLLGIASRFTLFDNTLIIRFTSKILKSIIIISGLLLILHQFFNLTSFVASIGILGAAFTFIAKDTLTNILSGIVLMIDKPFTIGDWIQLSDLEGIVEDVSFRSTRIRTFEQGLVVVPNMTLSNDNILNWSNRDKRRDRFSLGVTYDTPKESIPIFIDAIKRTLTEIESIEKESLLVYFDSFGESSLNIIVQYYTFKTDLHAFCYLKEEVNTKLLALAEEQGIEIAFPTQTLFINNTATHSS